ncbi:alpha/beta fold hydrolase [bacterium]|nr:alpha/beta fold hydrolase [bacterium]
MRRLISLLLILLLFHFACDKHDPIGPDIIPARGEIDEIKQLENSSASLIANLLSLAGIRNLWQMNYNVLTYSIIYYTENGNGDIVRASAAIMLPDNDHATPLLSIQHGTEIKRTSVASNGAAQSLEGVWGLAAASRGYAVVLPDYLGLGISETIHPYHLAGPTAAAVIDAIRAARQFFSQQNINLDSRLFLAGYSEGGYATMAAHREMQTRHGGEFQITASTPMAGAYNLTQTARYIISKNDYISPPYLALMLTAYNGHYNWDNLSYIFIPPYNTQIEDLVDGTHGYTTVLQALPNRLDALLTTEFRQAVADSTNSQIESALTGNSLLNWAPACPMHLYHGLADKTVPAFNSIAAMAAFTALAAPDVQLTTFQGLNHIGAALPAVTAAMQWFEEFWPES